mmetsp:Transcript_93231/g.263893  ORF Transcript_93231/g.263893 Transcript_93231/m.263893 type:complete len:234 (+) Transcript_93231:115-816(+)
MDCPSSHLPKFARRRTLGASRSKSSPAATAAHATPSPPTVPSAGAPSRATPLLRPPPSPRPPQRRPCCQCRMGSGETQQSRPGGPPSPSARTHSRPRGHRRTPRARRRARRRARLRCPGSGAGSAPRAAATPDAAPRRGRCPRAEEWPFRCAALCFLCSLPRNLHRPKAASGYAPRQEGNRQKLASVSCEAPPRHPPQGWRRLWRAAIRTTLCCSMLRSAGCPAAHVSASASL